MPAHTSYVTDVTNTDTSTGIIGIEYHLQAQLVHLKADITMGDDHHAPDTPAIDVMTEEAIAGLTLGLTHEIEV